MFDNDSANRGEAVDRHFEAQLSVASCGATPTLDTKMNYI
jgi:hypothetical protein